MPLVVRCPGCNTQHQVQDQLRGKSAKCRCGTVIQIPAGQASAANAAGTTAGLAAGLAAGSAAAVSVKCPGCSKVHQADSRLAGRMVRCGCGAAFQIPGGQTAPAPVMAQANDPLGLGPSGGGLPDDLFGDLGAAAQAAPMMANYSAGHYAGTAPNRPAANPYAPARETASSTKKKGVPGRCPKCGGGNYKTPVFTWWGGMVGQHIISHVVCQRCQTAFNSKTGGSNTKLIVIYHVVILAMVLPFVIMGIVFGNS